MTVARREFIGVLSSVLVASSKPARGQQSANAYHIRSEGPST
jgi:hypothetical protein